MSAQVDWPRLLGDLQYLLGEADPGNPNSRIPIGTPSLAKYLDVSRGTVRNMLDGTEPRYAEGERLIRVWVRLTGKAAANVPLTTRVLSAAGLKAP